MKEPRRLLSHGATDFERQLLRAVAQERPSALLRSRMQRSLGLVGPLAWASNVKAMFGSLGSRIAAGAAVAGVVAAGGVAAYQLVADQPAVEAPRPPVLVEAPAVAPVPAPPEPARPEPRAAPEAPAPALEVSGAAGADAPTRADDSEDSRLREEIALLDGVKAALQRGEREQARQSLELYRERFPNGILRREANVLRRRATTLGGATKPGLATDGAGDDD